MSAFKTAILCTILSFLCLALPAQTIRFNKYTSSDGLPSDEVYNLHQDKNGYLWVFTNFGALKFNGTEFKPVLKNLPFNESFIYSFHENEQGKKWIANSNAKIYEVINDSAFVVQGTEQVSELFRKTLTEIVQLHVDDSLNIYAITKHDSYKFTKKNSRYFQTNLSTGEKDSISYRIYEKNDKLFKILNYLGNDTTNCGGRENLKILIYAKDRTSYIQLDCGLSDIKHFKRYGNAIYFSQHNFLSKIVGGKVIPVISMNTIVLNFVKDHNNHLWVACYNNGLYELNEKDSVINHYFEQQTINDVLIDSQKGLWASSVGSGLYHCPDLNDLYFPETSALGKPISYIKKIEDKLYVANAMGDIFAVKNNNFSLFRKHIKEDEPQDILKIGSDYLLSSRYSLELLGFYNNKLSRVLPNTAIKLVSIGKDTILLLQRRRIFIMEKGLFKNILNFAYRPYDFRMRKDRIIVAMENGVWQSEAGGLTQPTYLEATKHSVIRSIVQDSLNNYWFCSIGNGLFKLNSADTLTHYSAPEHLPGNIINTISFGTDGILLSTNTGLYFTKTMDAKKILWKLIYAGSAQNAVFFERKIYISTQNGLVILDKKKLHDIENLHFNLSSIKINSRETNITSLKNLKHIQNDLEFSFDLISFNKDKYPLKYHLYSESPDSGIVEANTIVFQKLSPGNYTLVVFPNIINGDALKLELPFFIEPAFWQTNTFLLLVSTGIFLLGIIVLRLIFLLLRKKEARKNKAERLIQEYQLIALKAQINPHFMSNCLMAVQNLIINNKVEQATDYIGKFGMLVRQILNFSTRSLVTLQEELEITALNIELEQLRFEKKFLFELRIGEGVDAKSLFIPALILNPIIENAIWHGLLPLKNKRPARLTIDVKIESDTLLLIIEDNGVGRKGENKSLGNTRESKGIALTEQRLTNINYMFKIRNSRLVYVDLIEQDPADEGTRVIISLPTNLKSI